jgi:hypothetical protein
MHRTHDSAEVALRPYGLGWPTMSRAGRSPVGGGNDGHVETAVSLISTRLLKVISIRDAENAGTLGKRPFSDL